MPRGRKSKTGKNALSTELRDLEAVRLRLRGLTYDRIAEELGFSDRSGAYRSIMRSFGKIADEKEDKTRELRAMWEERIEDAYVVCERIATDQEDPDLQLKAVNQIKGLAEKAAALRGLNAPKQLELATMPDVSICIMPPKTEEDEDD